MAQPVLEINLEKISYDLDKVIWGIEKSFVTFLVKKTNEKRLVFDFQRSKLVSVIQCFKSFATQTVKHFNHDFQLFDTRLQIIWHFLQPFSILKFVVILSMSKNLNLYHSSITFNNQFKSRHTICRRVSIHWNERKKD